MNHQSKLNEILRLQDDLNFITDSSWKKSGYDWNRDIWLETSKIVSEIVDENQALSAEGMASIYNRIMKIFRFGLNSLLLQIDPYQKNCYVSIKQFTLTFSGDHGDVFDIESPQSIAETIEAAEDLIQNIISTNVFSFIHFMRLAGLIGITFDDIHQSYRDQDMFSRFNQRDPVFSKLRLTPSGLLTVNGEI